MTENKNTSFVSWQGTRIKQFGFVNHLLITIALSYLILEAKYFVGDDIIQPIGLLVLMALSSIFAFASLGVGGYIAVNRLLSFRYTAQVSRKRETGQRSNIEGLRDLTDELDLKTWKLLWWQVGLFSAGSLFLFAVNVLGAVIQISKAIS